MNTPGRQLDSAGPFYEAYFSNYIEGTEFTLAEAREIVFEGLVPQQRPKDAHDVLGTYQLVADAQQRARVPRSADELISILNLNLPAYVSVLTELQRRTGDVDFTTLAAAESDLRRRRAFNDPDDDPDLVSPLLHAADAP